MSHSVFQAPPSRPIAPSRSPSLPLELKFFLTVSYPSIVFYLVMSARKRKERSSDSQIFDSIQGNHSRVILSVCQNLFFFFFSPFPLCANITTTPQQISSSESKLNLITARTRRALIQLSLPSFTNFQLCPNVSSFYVPIRASPCWTTVKLMSSIGRVGLICFRRPLASLLTPPCPNRNLFMEPFQLYASFGG
jgi:hypothetical protein